MMKEKIYAAYEQMTPDTSTTDRMKANIQRRYHESPDDTIGRSNTWRRLAVTMLCLLCIAAISGTAYAAYQWLTAKDVAKGTSNDTLAQYFNEKNMKSQTITDGKYKVIYLGNATGKNISEHLAQRVENLDESKTYIAVGIKRTDGSSMSYDHSPLVTPLVHGVSPDKLNIYTINGTQVSTLVDKTLYYMIETDDIEIFAKKGVYIAVTESLSTLSKGFLFDKTSGAITVNKDYSGINVLFDAALDTDKADDAKAAQYIKQLTSSSVQNEENKETVPRNPDFKNPGAIERVIQQSSHVKGSTKTVSTISTKSKYEFGDISLNIASLIQDAKHDGLSGITLYGDKTDQLLTIRKKHDTYQIDLYDYPGQFPRKEGLTVGDLK